jgi:hypothetical protein
MHYLFVFMVALNACYLGYNLLKEKDSAVLQPIANVPQKNFPITLRLLPQRSLIDQISDISIKSPITFGKKVISTS